MKRTLLPLAVFLSCAVFTQAAPGEQPRNGRGNDFPRRELKAFQDNDFHRSHRFADDAPRRFQPGPEGRGFGPPPPPPFMHELGPLMERFGPFWEDQELAAEMGLSEEQVEKLAASFEETKQALDETSGTLKAAHDELHDLMESDSPEADAVYKALDEVTRSLNEKGRILLGHR